MFRLSYSFGKAAAFYYVTVLQIILIAFYFTTVDVHLICLNKGYLLTYNVYKVTTDVFVLNCSKLKSELPSSFK